MPGVERMGSGGSHKTVSHGPVRTATNTGAPTGVKSQIGQRERALNVTLRSPPGSVGAAIAGPLATATKMVGNFCAGDVGDYYESQRNMLSRPATRANIEAFTNLETKHFQKQNDCSSFVGGLLSAKDRAVIVEASARGYNPFAKIGQFASDGWSAVVRGGQFVGGKIGEGARVVVRGGQFVGGKIGDGWNAASRAVSRFFGGR